MFDLLPNQDRQNVDGFDYMSTGSSAGALVKLATGTNAGVGNGTGTALRPGIALATTGGDTAGLGGYATAATAIATGSSMIIGVITGVNFANLSAASDLYVFRFGLNSAVDGSQGTSFIGFEYGSALSSGSWRCVTAKAGGATSTQVATFPNTSYAVTAATDYSLGFIISPDNSMVRFYINGVCVNQSLNTNTIPTAPVGFAWSILKTGGSTGTTARTVTVDRHKFVQELINAR